VVEDKRPVADSCNPAKGSYFFDYVSDCWQIKKNATWSCTLEADNKCNLAYSYHLQNISLQTFCVYCKPLVLNRCHYLPLSKLYRATYEYVRMHVSIYVYDLTGESN
jgi:hypothetical protein